MQRLSPYMMNVDERGSFWGITQDSWDEINFVETSAQQVRGNHYHKQTNELFFIISGEIEIVIHDLRSGEHNEFCAKKGDVFIVKPYELHTFYTKTNSQWINMLSKKLEPQNPDFHRVESKT